MREALEESQSERKRFVQEQTLRLQSLYQSLQNAIDTAYEDGLRDVIDEELFRRKSKVWCEEMQEVEIELESIRKACRLPQKGRGTLYPVPPVRGPTRCP